MPFHPDPAAWKPERDDAWWERDCDASEVIREGEEVRMALDGGRVHKQVEAMLSRLDDEAVADIALSWLYLPPQLNEPFELIYEDTLAKLFQIPEARELSERLTRVIRFLISLQVRSWEEWQKRLAKSRESRQQ